MIAVKTTNKGDIALDNFAEVMISEVEDHGRTINTLGADMERVKAGVNMCNSAYKELTEMQKEMNESLDLVRYRAIKAGTVAGISIALNILAIAMIVVHILWW